VLSHRRTTRSGSSALPAEFLTGPPPFGPRERHVARVRGDHRRCHRPRGAQPHLGCRRPGDDCLPRGVPPRCVSAGCPAAWHCSTTLAGMRPRSLAASPCSSAQAHISPPALPWPGSARAAAGSRPALRAAPVWDPYLHLRQLDHKLDGRGGQDECGSAHQQPPHACVVDQPRSPKHILLGRLSRCFGGRLSSWRHPE
jgi:hypothetical protein